jgi:hypothetical protein
MAISCSMNVNNPTPAHGDTIVVTYIVDGNDPVDPTGSTISGGVVVDGVPYNLSASMTKPGTPAAPVVYNAPTCPGLSFQATSDPAVFTSVVP